MPQGFRNITGFRSKRPQVGVCLKGQLHNCRRPEGPLNSQRVLSIFKDGKLQNLVVLDSNLVPTICQFILYILLNQERTVVRRLSQELSCWSLLMYAALNTSVLRRRWVALRSDKNSDVWSFRGCPQPAHRSQRTSLKRACVDCGLRRRVALTQFRAKSMSDPPPIQTRANPPGSGDQISCWICRHLVKTAVLHS